MATDELRTAARAALDTHAALDVHDELEPPSSQDEPYEPFDIPAWQAWYQNRLPLSRAWREAMHALEAADPEHFPGRHPFYFGPYCDKILED